MRIIFLLLFYFEIFLSVTETITVWSFHSRPHRTRNGHQYLDQLFTYLWKRSVIRNGLPCEAGQLPHVLFNYKSRPVTTRDSRCLSLRQVYLDIAAFVFSCTKLSCFDFDIGYFREQRVEWNTCWAPNRIVLDQTVRDACERFFFFLKHESAQWVTPIVGVGGGGIIVPKVKWASFRACVFLIQSHILTNLFPMSPRKL